jgi:hypothetical protein
MNRAGYFSWDTEDGLTFAVGESDSDRASAFMKPFLARGVARKEGVFIDSGGHPLAISPVWVDGLDRYASSEIERAAAAIVNPDEIRVGWAEAADHSKILVRRYFARVDGVDVAVEVGRAGWRFATSLDPNYKFTPLLAGDIVWSAPSQA